MTAITITDMDLELSNLTYSVVKFGAAAVRGVVIKDKADNDRWKNGKCDSTDVLAGKDGLGILVHPVSTVDRGGLIITGGVIYINSVGTLTEGTSIALGATAGQMTEDSDIATMNWFKTHLGVIGSTTATNDEFQLNLKFTGHQIP